jgi:Ribonuclease T2 family
MNTYWLPDRGSAETFWEHEWNKHGTCINTLAPSCYGDSYSPGDEVVDFFSRTVELFKVRSSLSPRLKAEGANALVRLDARHLQSPPRRRHRSVQEPRVLGQTDPGGIGADRRWPRCARLRRQSTEPGLVRVQCSRKSADWHVPADFSGRKQRLVP